MSINLEMEDFFAEDEDLIGIEELESLDEDSLDDLEETSTEDEEVDTIEEVNEEDVIEEDVEPKKDIVNTVERYSSTDLKYPCFVLDGSEVFPKHIISGLTKMIESSLTIEDTIKVYVSINGDLSSIGGVSSLQVKAIIDLLGRDKITAYYEKGYVLNGDLIYALSS
jgi:hypothetical protein